MLKKWFLSVFVILAILAIGLSALLAWPLPEVPNLARQGDFLIRNVAVVDVQSGVVHRRRDVIVVDGKIISDNPAGTSRVDASLVVIDGSGKYLIPGLWDMHTHSLKVSPQYMHPLFIANGVTGVRDMSGCMSEPDSFFACIDDREYWNESIGKERRVSPRYVLQSSFQINGGNEVPAGYPAFFKLASAEDASQLAAFYQRIGADFLKIYTELSPQAYQALAGAAHEAGLAMAGHRPLRVSLEDALSAGQRSIEHPRLFLLECFRDADAFRALEDPLAAYDAGLRWQLVDGQDPQRCQALMQAMAEAGTWWVPTMQVLRMGAMAGNREFREDQRLKYIPAFFSKLVWEPDAERAARQPADAAGRELYPALYQMAQEHVRQAYESGVKVLVGTDSGDTYVFPGFGVHDELVELVRAGMPPAAALRGATLDAALFAGLENEFGSITVGKAGDMLLLDANPLEDIAQTQAISGVFYSGQYFDRSALDELLRFAEEQAGSYRLGLRLAWDGLNSPLLRVQLAD
ncbi:hypothetical protein E4634_09075 [Mangrovimicrobium sediminis]|uniref:Amidohydrolase-related domain-containing protein n=1 Tax=Mangrovimicrobium sediminis TaxID=2562682 RepID=A0A4Z0M3K0_9GAMM|nr:amidohydrolase family protein [Haliea sp. SAOS-164]TGD74263.1 hypothetical protein E4634_09075 [Haliea sp. SAOS-164]